MSTLDDLLRARGLYVTCPSCDESFPARRGRLFDATKPLPDYAVAHLTEARAALEEGRRNLRAQRKDLGQQRLSLEQRAIKTAIESGAISLRVADHSLPTE